MVHGVLVAISHLIHQQRKGRSVIRLGVSQLEGAFIHEIRGRFYNRLNFIQLLLLWAFQVLSLLYVDPSLPESQSEVDCHLHRSTGSFSKKFLDTVYWRSLGQHFIFQLSLNPATNSLSNRGVHAVVESHGCVRRHWAWVLVPLIPRDGQIYQKNVTTKIWWKELGKGGMTRRGKCPMESWTPYERIPRSIALQSIPICSWTFPSVK